jgi:hypothetical protein
MVWAALAGFAGLLSVLVTGALYTTAKTLNAPELVTLWAIGHRHAGEAGGALGIAIFGVIAWKQPKVRKVAWGLCGGLLVQAGLGSVDLGPMGGALHAMVAQALVAGAAGIAVLLSQTWAAEPMLIQDYGWPSLRSLSISLPTLIGLQILLGALFRQGLMGLMPHVIGAMLVSMFILMVGAFVLQQCKDHQALAGSGKKLMVTTFVQVFLGIAIFTFRSMAGSGSSIVLALAAAHVATGALLLSASVVLSMHIRRNVTPKPAK